MNKYTPERSTTHSLGSKESDIRGSQHNNTMKVFREVNFFLKIMEYGDFRMANIKIPQNQIIRRRLKKEVKEPARSNDINEKRIICDRREIAKILRNRNKSTKPLQKEKKQEPVKRVMKRRRVMRMRRVNSTSKLFENRLKIVRRNLSHIPQRAGSPPPKFQSTIRTASSPKFDRMKYVKNTVNQGKRNLTLNYRTDYRKPSNSSRSNIKGIKRNLIRMRIKKRNFGNCVNTNRSNGSSKKFSIINRSLSRYQNILNKRRLV